MSNESTKPIKVAYIIFGPESAGNRMMARSFDTAGVPSPFSKNGEYVSGPHPEPTFTENPLLISRSVPFDGQWEGFRELVDRVEFKGYDRIYTVMLTRDFEAMARSQVVQGRIDFRNEYINTDEDALEAAKRNIKRAYSMIEKAFFGTGFRKLSYEKFVTDPAYRKKMFEWFGLPEPTLEYFNANERGI